MQKWIDLKVRQPKQGQLVVVSTPKPGSTTEVHLEICAFGNSQDWRFPPELNATHWYPLPAIREEPDPDRERLRENYSEIYWRCVGLEQSLRTLAPMINWSVMPDADFDRVVPRFNYAWKIKGSVEVNGLTLDCERIVMDEILHSAGGYLDYVVRGIVYEISQGILK